MILDLPDDRRSAKPWLPQDGGLDVTSGLVIENWKHAGGGRPRCVAHGAMNRIDPTEQLYRCTECGVGARWAEEELEFSWDDIKVVRGGITFGSSAKVDP